MSDRQIIVSEKSNFYDIVNKKGWTVIDGNYDVDKLTIIPEHKKLIRWEPGKATVTLGLNPENIFNDINEGISFRGLSNILSEKKLCLNAINLRTVVKSIKYFKLS